MHISQYTNAHCTINKCTFAIILPESDHEDDVEIRGRIGDKIAVSEILLSLRKGATEKTINDDKSRKILEKA